MRSGQRPSYIIVLMAVATVVPLVTLMWLGWRLLDQDRMLEQRQVQDRVERAADLIVAEIERAISASGRRLVSGNKAWPEGAVALVFERGRVRVYPRDRVAYVPVAQTLPEAPAGAFADGERLEFRLNDSAGAIEVRQQAYVRRERAFPRSAAGGFRAAAADAAVLSSSVPTTRPEATGRG